MTPISVSAVEVRGLTPAASVVELRDLFCRVAPVLQITTTCNLAKDALSAIVLFEGVGAASQATQAFQGYCLHPPHRLVVSLASGLGLQLGNMMQQWQMVSCAVFGYGGRS